MIKKYRTGGYGKDLITAIDTERETNASVWINGRRSAKVSSYMCYFDSWQEAYDFLIDGAEKKLNSARRSLEVAQGYYGNIKGLTEPMPDKPN